MIIIARCIALFLLGSMLIAAQSVTSSLDLRVPVQPTPVIISGTPRLFYELHLTNFTYDKLILNSLQILDANTDRVVVSFGSDALDLRFTVIGLSAAKTEKRVIQPGIHAVIYLEFEIDKREIPKALKHQIEYHIGSAQTSATVEGAKISIASESLIQLDPPLRGGPWAAIYDASWERGHRRVFYAIDGTARIPGRFAIDWIQLDSQGKEARGDSDRVSNWYGYGADVLAVADAVVAATREDVRESASVSGNTKHALVDATGNYVALNLGKDRFAFYEHLKPGSIRVKPGQRVHRGQTIASLGFTGDSTGPHLHFHVADGNTPLGGEGMPYVLRAFKLMGSYDSLDQFGIKLWNPHPNIAESHRTAEFPASKAVVMFDDDSESR